MLFERVAGEGYLEERTFNADSLRRKRARCAPGARRRPQGWRAASEIKGHQLMEGLLEMVTLSLPLLLLYACLPREIINDSFSVLQHVLVWMELTLSSVLR